MFFKPLSFCTRVVTSRHKWGEGKKGGLFKAVNLIIEGASIFQFIKKNIIIVIIIDQSYVESGSIIK